MTTIGVIGLGRVGTAIARAVATLDPADGHALTGVSTRRTDAANTLAGEVGVPLPERSAADLLAGADVTVLAVPDDAIATVANDLAALGPPPAAAGAVVHCSGALDATPLAPLADLGWSVGAWHPLQAFPTRSSPLREGITWAITAPKPLTAELLRLSRDLGGHPFVLPAQAKPRYHCAASMAANYLVTQVWHATGLLESCGLSRAEALTALVPLLESTVAGLARAGLPDGLTGPLARGDVATIETHLSVLGEFPATERLYREAGTATLPILLQRGLDPAVVARLKARLRSHDSE